MYCTLKSLEMLLGCRNSQSSDQTSDSHCVLLNQSEFQQFANFGEVMCETMGYGVAVWLWILDFYQEHPNPTAIE